MNTTKRFEKGGDDYMVQFSFGLTTLAFSYLNGGRGLRIRQQITRIMKTLAILLIASACNSFSQTTNYYVATDGSDSNLGTSTGAPFLTVSKAFAAIVALNQATWQKNIFVRGGSYYNVYVQPTSFDRCYNTALQSYPGERAILYGGQLLTTWTDNGDGTWKASLGDFPTAVTNAYQDHWEPRTLLVNGTPALWARYPAATYGNYPDTDKLWFTSVSGTPGVLVYTNTMEATTNNEVCIDNSWSDTVFEVYSNNVTEKTLTAKAAIGRGGQCTDVYTYALRNGKEGMTADNMFWWDKTNSTIVYRPASGVDPNTLTIVVPTVRRIMYIPSAGGIGISNLVVSNITFAVTTAYNTTVIGANDAAAGDFLSAISLTSPTNCVMDGVEIYCTGGPAVNTTGGTYGGGNVWRNNVIHDCGTSGVEAASFFSVHTNNLIYNCGLIHQSGAGLLYKSGDIIDGNTISNCVGAAITSVASTSGNTNVIIRNNWIQRCVKALRDYGAIYGHNSTNIYIIHNWLSDIPGTNANSITFGHRMGIYPDADSEDYVVNSNILFNCSIPIELNEATSSNYFGNNVMIGTTATCPSYYFQSWTNQNRVWEKNVWIASGLLSSRIAVYVVDHNEYYTIDLGCADWTGNITYSTGASNAGNPTNATSADPLFVLVPTSTPAYLSQIDLTFQGGSPAPALGIQPLSISGIGYNGGLPYRRASSISGRVVISGKLTFQ